MSKLSYHLEDKKNWGDGPWQNEPDFETFIYRDYCCVINRHINRGGQLNGYVAVKPDSKWAKKDYEDINLLVHGGITFSRLMPSFIEEEEGTFKEHYWIGFDCAHDGDLAPKFVAHEEFVINYEGDNKAILGLRDIYKSFPMGCEILRGTYKDIEFVRNELKSLVDQIIKNENE